MNEGIHLRLLRITYILQVLLLQDSEEEASHRVIVAGRHVDGGCGWLYFVLVVDDPSSTLATQRALIS